MPDWRSLVRGQLAALGLSPHVEACLVDEIAEHLETGYERRLAAGEAPEDAAREMLAAFNRDGALVQRLRALRRGQPEPETRPSRRASSRGGALMSDLRTIGRRLRREWLATSALVVTLAAGIGATAAVGSASKLIVVHPLPFGGTDRLVNVWLLRASRDNWHFHVPPPDAEALRAATGVFDRVELYDSDRRVLTRGTGGRSVNAAVVPAGFFDLFDLRPQVGRLFDANDDADGDNNVAVLGDAFWRREFGASPDVVGTIVRLDDAPFRVAGVLPRGFAFPPDIDVWTRRRGTDQSNGYVLVRLRVGVSSDMAQRAMPAVVSAITNGRPNPGMSFRIESLRTTTTRHARLPWLLLLAAAGCVAVIAFLNVSNLLLLRAVGRRRDAAVRLALGAGRRDIMRLVAVEAAILTTVSAAASLVVADWAMSALRTWAPTDTPRRADLHVDATVFVIASSLSFFCWLLLTLIPGLALWHAGREGGLGTAGTAAFGSRRDSSARSLLVLAEVALAFVLLTAACLFGTSMLRLTAIDPGFQPDHLLVVRLTVSKDNASRHAQPLQTIDRIQGDLRLAPGISAAVASTGNIMTGLGLIDAQRTLAQRIARDSGPLPQGPEEAHFRRVGPGFFRTLGIAIVEGRDFSDADRTGGQPVAIVNQAMARDFWGTTAVVGRRVSFERLNGAPAWLEIIGVAADTRDLALTTAPQPAFFAPLAQAQTLPGDGLTLFVRTKGEPAASAAEVRRLATAAAPGWPAPDVSTMDDAVDRFVAGPRFRAGLVTSLAVIGLLLAALGVYTVVSHMAASRAPEIAVRLALGASPGRIARDVIGQGLRLGAVGMAIGVALSFSMRRLVTGLLFGVGTSDPLVVTFAPAVLLVMVLTASYLPARRAARTDFSRVMRGD